MNKTFLCKQSLSASLALALAITPVLGAEQLTTDAALLGPSGVLVTQSGDIYVTDEKNNNLINLTDGTVVAGYTLPNDVYGLPAGGYQDGTTAAALFDSPMDLVEWNGGLVISDTDNHVLRFMVDGTVTTLAGTGSAGSANGTTASFYLPRGLAVDGSGNLYVADSGNGTIRKITTSGVVSTYYSGMEAPCGLAWYDGSLYATDMATHEIVQITNGKGQVIAGVSTADEDVWAGGFADGPVLQAQFQNPQDIAVTADGIFIADTGNGVIRVIRNDRVSTLVSLDLQGTGTWPALPSGIDVADGVLYGADPFAGVVFTADATASTFVDGSETDWWFDTASILADAHIMTGYADSSFAPNNTLSRGMMATVLQNYAQSRDRSAILLGTSDFTDVTDTLWCGDAIDWLSTQGITLGYSDGSFGVNDGVSRQDLAVFLYRYAQVLDVDTTASASLEAFTDADSVSAHAQEALEWAVAVGVLNGTTDGALLPTAMTTRAQAATMLCNWMVAIDG